MPKHFIGENEKCTNEENDMHEDKHGVEEVEGGGGIKLSDIQKKKLKIPRKCHNHKAQSRWRD